MKVDPIVLKEQQIITQPAPLFSDITSITGKIIEIGSKTLDGKSCIRLDCVPYQINVSAEMENALLKFFKKQNVILTINRKLRFDEKVLSADLISYTPVNTKTMGEKVDKLRKIRQDAFGDIIDTVKSVRNLRK